MTLNNIEDFIKLSQQSQQQSQQQNMEIPPHLEGLNLPHIEQIFPKTVAIYKFDAADQLELKNFILNYIASNECHETNPNGLNTTSWFNSSTENLLNLDEPIIKKFKSFLSTSYEILVKIYQWKMEPEHTISECWINRSTKGGYQNKHTHSNAWVSGTYYLKFSENSSPIRFWDNIGEVNTPYLRTEIDGINPFNSPFVDLKPTEGCLFLWPSNYQHETLPDQSDERISISMNFIPNQISFGSYTINLSK